MSARIIQDVKSGLVNDMNALACKRSTTGEVNGKLKFRSQYNSISTKMCPICGAIKDDITLSDRI